MSEVTIVLLAWVLGALCGAFATAVYTWWALVTGRRTVRPYHEVITRTETK